MWSAVLPEGALEVGGLTYDSVPQGDPLGHGHPQPRFKHGRPSVFVRITRTLMYFCFIIAGVYSYFIPAPALNQTIPQGYIFWVGFLVVGGMLTTIGYLVKLRPLEYMGLPLLITVFLIYGIALWITSGGPGTAARAAVAFIFLAFGFGLTARLLDVLATPKRNSRIDELMENLHGER